MSARAPLPRYIPPPTTFLLSRPGMTYGSKPLRNRNWDLVRTNVQDNRLQVGDRNGFGGTSYGDKPKWKQTQEISDGRHNQRTGPRTMRHNGMNEKNDGQRSNGYQGKRFQDGDDEELQTIEHQQLHYAQPDFSKIFDEVDEISESREENKHDEARPIASDHNIGSGEGENGVLPTVNQDYDDDMDWQKREERDDDKKYDWSRKTRRNNSVYDPETTKVRARQIDQTNSEAEGKDRGNELGSVDVKRRSRRAGTTKEPGIVKTGSRKESEGAASLDVNEEKSSSDPTTADTDATAKAELIGDGGSEDTKPDIEESEEESKDESGSIKDDRKNAIKQRFNSLNDTIKKCTSKFAEKLLDALEQQKSDCMIQFDEICKKHKQNSSEPIFSSYSCENGQTTESFRDTIKKKVSGLVGGVYTKACKGADAIREVAEELIDEIKPQNDGSWSQIGGETGIRCVPHYDNRIEDHTVYVCSCCFNEVIERDAHVNVKYFDPDFGCSKPKIVSRSFENRPYFCEKLLASMSKKRRSCFLKVCGEKHQMKGGVHCISVIPSMEEEFLAQEGKSQSCSGAEN